MTIHSCRDFLTIGNPLTTYQPYMCAYLLALFCRTVLGYTTVGNTNFDVDSGTFRLGTGVNGSYNQGTLNTQYAFVPNGYVVTLADIGRILAVRSVNNPLLNSGLFRVTAVDTVNNYLFLNNRSGDTPPAETGLTWSLYVNENIAINTNFQFGNNGGTGYKSNGSATTSRIIMQSPDASGWQLRICIEASTNSSAGAVTFAPGFGGDSHGDFPVGGQVLHGQLYFNYNQDSTYVGSSVGIQPNNNVGTPWQLRVYIWGNDATGSVVIAVRGVINSTHGWAAFGLCEDEELPLPPSNVQRLFAGGNYTNGNHGDYIDWASGPGTNHGVVGFGLSNTPIIGSYANYCWLNGTYFGNNGIRPRADPAAGDNPYTLSTELQSVDVVVGTWDTPNALAQAEILILEGRRLGRFPIARLGRINFGDFMVSTDPLHSWFHTQNGVYLPWQGSILP